MVFGVDPFIGALYENTFPGCFVDYAYQLTTYLLLEPVALVHSSSFSSTLSAVVVVVVVELPPDSTEPTLSITALFAASTVGL